MKKLILSFVIILNFTFGFSQCPISFDDLKSSLNYSSSQFEIFALKSGYHYNANEEMFFCDKQQTNNSNDILARYDFEKIMFIAYSFSDKLTYLNFKEILERNFKITGDYKEKGKIETTYSLDDLTVTAISSTTKNNVNFYTITFSKSKNGF